MKKSEAEQELQIITKKFEAEKSKLLEVINKKITAEERFLELTNNLIQKFDFEKEAVNIYYINNDGKIVYNLDYENGYIYFNYNLFWSIFESEFGMNYQEIQAFAKGQMEEHFKTKGLTPDKK